MENEILVSVICNAYNHEKYIKKTLDGFVMQKTNFRFEVLVHDDASTDRTAEIIREYEAKYPDIIKPIYQKENQYSQHISIKYNFQLPRVKGKYIAICEGDDCWLTEDKLQKQVDCLEANPNIYCCATGVRVFDIIKQTATEKQPVEKPRLLEAKELFLNGGEFLATCSLVMRKEVYADIPPEFKISYCGDLQPPIYALILGGVYCLPDVTCQYNINVAGSWTQRAAKQDKQKQLARMNELIQFYIRVNQFSNLEYDAILQQKISQLYVKRYYKFGVAPDSDFSLKHCSIKYQAAFLYASLKYGKKSRK